MRQLGPLSDADGSTRLDQLATVITMIKVLVVWKQAANMLPGMLEDDKRVVGLGDDSFVDVNRFAVLVLFPVLTVHSFVADGLVPMILDAGLDCY